MAVIKTSNSCSCQSVEGTCGVGPFYGSAGLNSVLLSLGVGDI